MILKTNYIEAITIKYTSSRVLNYFIVAAYVRDFRKFEIEKHNTVPMYVKKNNCG